MRYRKHIPLRYVDGKRVIQGWDGVSWEECFLGGQETLPEGATVVKQRGLGTVVERTVKPLARAMGSQCLDEDSNLKQGSPCQQIRDALNQASRFGPD